MNVLNTAASSRSSGKRLFVYIAHKSDTSHHTYSIRTSCKRTSFSSSQDIFRGYILICRFFDNRDSTQANKIFSGSPIQILFRRRYSSCSLPTLLKISMTIIVIYNLPFAISALRIVSAKIALLLKAHIPFVTLNL